MDISRFKKLPILGIIRGVEPEAIEPLVDAVISSGLETIEIAMNSRKADELIRRAVKASNKKLMIGAGTVMNLEILKVSLDAGATFIVTPTLVSDVVGYCVKNVIPVFPGALTPTEIYAAWSAGATMVKVFPSNFFGPSYMKEVKGPFNNIELLACGGVNAKNIRTFFSNGASAVAFGASIFRKSWIDDGNFKKIERSIRELISRKL